MLTRPRCPSSSPSADIRPAFPSPSSSHSYFFLHSSCKGQMKAQNHMKSFWSFFFPLECILAKCVYNNDYYLLIIIILKIMFSYFFLLHKSRDHNPSLIQPLQKKKSHFLKTLMKACHQAVVAQKSLRLKLTL